MRLLHVAAFAVSGYSSTEDRNCKPFNPLLGETYEAEFPDKGVRFFSEKVRFTSTYPSSSDIAFLKFRLRCSHFLYLVTVLKLSNGHWRH